MRVRVAAALLLGVLAVVLSFGVGPSTYYFSDCVSGGSGTINDPYCLDPAGGATNEFLMALFDGSGTQAVAGDTLVICCGGTDGCGDATTTCTIAPAATGASTSTFSPGVDGTGNPITIQSYPGDNPTITGDLNSNGTCDSGDANYLIYNLPSGYHFIGPMTWSRACIDAVHYVQNNSDQLWQDVRITEADKGAWADQTHGPKDVAGIGDNEYICSGGGNPGYYCSAKTLCAGGANQGHVCTSNGDCPSSTCSGDWATCNGGACVDNPDKCYADSGGGFGIYNASSTGDFTLRRVTVDHICGMALRHIQATGGTWTVEDSQIYDVAQLSNDWGTYNWRTLTGQSTIYHRNQFWDFQNGISIEDRNRYVTIEDNDFLCKGVYDVSADGYAKDCAAQGAAIQITGGDDAGGCPHDGRSGSNADYTIRRNRFAGARYNGDSTSLNGWFSGAIAILDGCRNQAACTAPGEPWWCCDGPNQWHCNQGGQDNNGCSYYYGCLADGTHTNVVENNMLWDIWNNVGTSSRNPTRTGIHVSSNVPVTIRGNTGFRVRHALEVDDGQKQTGTAIAHQVQDNIFAQGGDVECYLDGTTGAVFDHNLCGSTLSPTRAGYQKGATTYTCDQLGAGALSTVTCATPNFIDAGSLDATRWNLHIRYPSPGIIGAGICAASTDYDGTTRPLNGTCELGADETPFTAITLDQQPQPGPAAAVVIRGKAGQ